MIAFDDYRLLNAILRNDLVAFIHRVFQTVAPGDRYIDNWHMQALAHQLQLCATGKTTRLIVTLPPRSGKSIAVSVAFVAWLLGHDPTLKIVCASYSKDLASKHSRDCRAVMQSDWYRELFPQTRLDPSKMSEDELTTTARGHRLATSPGATLTGLGGSIIIVDDSLKSEDAYSEVARDRVNHWFRSTLLSRLDDKRTGSIIIVQQRLHENDLVGEQLARNPKGWKHLNLPAIAPALERVEIGNGRYHVWNVEEVLHAEREPLDNLKDIERDMGSAMFSAQYLQAPLPADGAMVKRSWFSWYEHHQLPSNFDRIVQVWDTASKLTERSDFSVGLTCGVAGQNIYILGVLRKKLEIYDLLRAVKSQDEIYRPKEIVIEETSSGIALAQLLKKEALTGHVHTFLPKGDKSMRVSLQVPTIEAGLVFLPKTAPWLDELLHEVTIFPNGKHDDQIDALAMAIAWIKTRTVPGQWVFDMMAEDKKMGRY